ncbi:MAG: LPS-assembly protein LptD [Caulobacteraceae bacterium]|nr:LPS-assembly protein LptD [Caulobacteraceae bacterium]
MQAVWCSWRHGGRAALLAGSALAAVSAMPAAAQTSTDLPIRRPGMVAPVLPEDLPKIAPIRPPPPGPDDLGQNGFYIEADNLIRDDKNNIWIARGEVEARYQGHVIRGDEVIYRVGPGTVTVNGHGQLINPNGTVLMADHLTLDDKLRAGFARGFSTIEPHNIRFAADVAIRRSTEVNELDRAVFTPCNVCASDGRSVTPTWSIQASKVIEDHTKHIVYYRNAVIQVKGIPVLYAPVFWHPDPEAKRVSGLLMPEAEISKDRGFSYQQSYYWAISPSQELYITPQINTKVNPLLDMEYRERFYSGQIDIRGGYTYEQDFNSNGHRFGDLTSRSYILADGSFNLNNYWSWGFTADRASDRYIFQKYDVQNVYEYQSQYTALSQQLLSQIHATRQDVNSYLSISTLSFQGLSSSDINGTYPLVAPLVEAHYEPRGAILGGRLQMTASGVLLNQSLQLNPTSVSPTDLTEPGIDSRRATGEINWLRTFILGNGMRLDPFLDVREDFYDVNDRAAPGGFKTYGRNVSNLGLDFSWPFMRQSGGATVVLEPLAQLLIAPQADNNPNIPNEDSQAFNFDETNLFSINRFAGYDLVDGGERLNLAGRATVDWGDGENAQLMIGKVLRAHPLAPVVQPLAGRTSIYPVNTGLNATSSDWVVAANTTPFPGVSFFGRGLLNNNANIESQEYGVDLAYDNARGYLRYDSDNTQPGGRISNIEAAGDFFVTEHWGFSLVGVRDLEVQEWRLQDLGLIYRNECIRVEVVYQQQGTINGALGKSDAVYLRLTLATLGGQRNNDDDFR